MMLAKSLQSAAGNAAAEANYIEDVFSTYLYTGNGSTQTITNGIDLAGEGGLVWTKMRNTGAFGNSDHWLFDTARGVEKKLSTNTTGGQGSTSGALEQFNSDGYQLGYTGGGYYELNYTGNTYASWTFRKQPKFFDVVTYTGDGTFPRSINHNLGSVPGCVIVKCTSIAGTDWIVWHRGLNATQPSQDYVVLNSTAAKDSGNYIFYGNQGQLSSTQFGGFGPYDEVNTSGATYVAYLFAHDAGGFGLSGEDNVISCGSYTSNSGGAINVELGFEPQWILLKNTAGRNAGWVVLDTMRGFSQNAVNNLQLLANGDNGDLDVDEPGAPRPTATGFSLASGNNYAEYNYNTDTIIYIAIRRGPMKVPESGTSVFVPATRTGNDTSSASTAGFPVDLGLTANRGAVAWKFSAADRLRGATFLRTAGTNAEGNPNSEYTASSFASNTQLTLNGSGDIVNANANTYIDLMFQRAPGFFDVVCYTGDGSSSRNISHNLQVVPELLIIKSRNNGTRNWDVLHSYDASGLSVQFLNLTNASAVVTYGGNSVSVAAPTSTTFNVGSSVAVNSAVDTYVAYLFASTPGVSKVFNYTGNGSSQTINCGFTGGARFVMIKRTDDTGDWYVWDTARGIVAGDDPHLSLNTTAAEVTTDDSVDTASTGFIVNQLAATNINVSSATYIGLAIA